MEEMVTKLVDNTFKDFSFEEAKKIIVDRILFYERKIMQLQEGQLDTEEKRDETTTIVCDGICEHCKGE